MKFFKFILVTLIIVIFTGIIPFFIYNKLNDTSYYSNPTGPAKYLTNIIQNENATQEIKDETINLMQEYSNMLHYNKENLMNLFIYISALFAISLIAIGIFLLKKTDYKSFGKCLIIAGVISIIIFMYIYFYTLSLLPPYYNL